MLNGLLVMSGDEPGAKSVTGKVRKLSGYLECSCNHSEFCVRQASPNQRQPDRHPLDITHRNSDVRVSADGGGELPVGRKLDGVDLMPYLRGKTQGESHETLFWREGYHQAVQHRGWKLIRSDLPAGAKWLFNLIEDPT